MKPTYFQTRMLEATAANEIWSLANQLKELNQESNAKKFAASSQRRLKLANEIAGIATKYANRLKGFDELVKPETPANEETKPV